MLGAKEGMPVKPQILALGEGFAEADGAVVGDADDVAGVGLVGGTAVPGHEGDGVVHRDQLAAGPC